MEPHQTFTATIISAIIQDEIEVLDLEEYHSMTRQRLLIKDTQVIRMFAKYLRLTKNAPEEVVEKKRKSLLREVHICRSPYGTSHVGLSPSSGVAELKFVIAAHSYHNQTDHGAVQVHHWNHLIDDWFSSSLQEDRQSHDIRLRVENLVGAYYALSPEKGGSICLNVSVSLICAFSIICAEMSEISGDSGHTLTHMAIPFVDDLAITDLIEFMVDHLEMQRSGELAMCVENYARRLKMNVPRSDHVITRFYKKHITSHVRNPFPERMLHLYHAANFLMIPELILLCNLGFVEIAGKFGASYPQFQHENKSENEQDSMYANFFGTQLGRDYLDETL